MTSHLPSLFTDDDLHCCAGPRWPVHVTSPHGITEVGCVVLTRAHDEQPAEFLAWTAVGRQPTLLARVEWLPASSSVPLDGAGTWTVDTVQGVWRVSPGRGCAGCGSIFRDWVPTNINRRYSMPKELGSAL